MQLADLRRMKEAGLELRAKLKVQRDSLDSQISKVDTDLEHLEAIIKQEQSND